MTTESVAIPPGLSRRTILLAGVALLAPAHGWSQTLIEDSPSVGRGWMPQAASPARTHRIELAVQQPPSAPPDWRAVLLEGERSILMRRNGEGGAQRYRYRLADGSVDARGYAAACYLLRDVRANRVFPIDPQLLDVLCGIQRWLDFHGRKSVIRITSGYRTAATNSHTEGAARNSMHLRGKAADIVIDGASSGLVGAMVRLFNADGGTGIYLNRGFVHVDTGAARTWVSTARR